MATVEMISAKSSTLRRYLRLYDPSKHDAAVCSANKAQWMEKVDRSYEALLNCAENIATSEEVEKLLDEATNDFQAFLVTFNKKCTGSSGGEVPGNGEKVKMAEVDIKIDAQKIDLGVRQLRAEVRPHENWAEADSHDIEVAMKAQQEWAKELKYLQERVWAMRRNVECFGIDSAELRRCEVKVKELRNQVEDVMDIIKHEDVTRALYSLNTSNNNNLIKYPTFCGAIGEDFIKFRKDITNAFKVNRVRADDQVSKLRENLDGDPLSLVPETLTRLEDAFDILAPIYGDAARLMDSKKETIEALGPFPEAEDEDFATAGEVREQIQWLIQFETNVADLYELAALSDEVDRDVFNLTTYRDLLRPFNLEVLKKLSQSGGSARDRVDALYQYVIEEREALQNTLKYLPNSDGDG